MYEYAEEEANVWIAGPIDGYSGIWVEHVHA